MSNTGEPNHGSTCRPVHACQVELSTSVSDKSSTRTGAVTLARDLFCTYMAWDGHVSFLLQLWGLYKATPCQAILPANLECTRLRRLRFPEHGGYHPVERILRFTTVSYSVLLARQMTECCTGGYHPVERILRFTVSYSVLLARQMTRVLHRGRLVLAEDRT